MRCNIVGAVRFSEVLDPRLMIPFDMKAVVRLAKVTSACVGNSRTSSINCSLITINFMNQ